jgi:hypothetical protein
MTTFQYGITTTLARLDDLLPQTVASLAAAGFDEPRLFVDGCDRPAVYDHFGLKTHCRPVSIGNFGNWRIAMSELFHANPDADFYAIFEDDILACPDLRKILESPLPEKGYFNLFLWESNERLSHGRSGWFESHQTGMGAVGLVFRRSEVVNLLSSPTMSRHPLRDDGRYRVDGVIRDSLAIFGVKEHCHFPSLLQHCGIKTTIPRETTFVQAASFGKTLIDAKTETTSL